MDYKTLFVKCVYDTKKDQWVMVNMKLPDNFESLSRTPLTFPCSICGNTHTVFIDPKDKTQKIYKVVTVTGAPEEAIPEEPILYKSGVPSAKETQKEERDLTLYAKCPITGETVRVGLTLPEKSIKNYTFQCESCGNEHTIGGNDMFHLPGRNN